MEVDRLKINKLDIQQNRDCIEYVSLSTKNPRKFQVLGRFTTLQDLMPGLHVRGGSRTRRAPGAGTLPRTHWPRCSVLSLESKIDRVDCPCGKADTNSRAERCFTRAGTPLQGAPTCLPGSSKEAGHPAAGRSPALLGAGLHHLPGELPWASPLQYPAEPSGFVTAGGSQVEPSLRAKQETRREQLSSSPLLVSALRVNRMSPVQFQDTRSLTITMQHPRASPVVQGLRTHLAMQQTQV